MRKTIRKIFSIKNIFKKDIKMVFKNNTIVTIIIGSIISILLGIIVGSSMAKYQEEKIINVFASIAKPILEIEKQETFKITNTNYKDSYLFEVRNYNEKEINEIEMEYYIEIISDANDILSFNLYKNQEKLELINNKTKKIDLNKENKDIHMYRLDIEYDKEKDNSKENISKDLEIKIHAIQKNIKEGE